MSTILAAVVIGAHLYTAHAQPDEGPRLNNSNTGLYVMADTSLVRGLTAGFYRNSYDRLTVYAGKTWQTDNKRWALFVGGATGYQYRREYGQAMCRAGYLSTADNPCSRERGASHSRIRLLAAPSFSWREAAPYLGGITPRLSLVGGKGMRPSVHIGLELWY